MQVITNKHVAIHKLSAFAGATTSDHKPVLGICSARLFTKIRNDTMRDAPLFSPRASGAAAAAAGVDAGGGKGKKKSKKKDKKKDKRGSSVSGDHIRRQSTNSRFSEAAVRTAVVRFSRMQARGLKSADLNGKSDPYLKFHAVPFRDYLVNAVNVSKKKKATLNPEWKNTDVPELATVLCNNAQLKELVIAVSLWDHDVSSPDDPLGDALIPIGAFLPEGADPAACTDIPPQKFNKRLTLHGQQSNNGAELGYIRGMVSVTWQWDAGFAGDDSPNACAVQ